MNLIHTLAAYAKLLAPRLPLSTAVRLTYEHQDDYTALAQDLVGLTGGRVLYGDAVEFLTRCAALVALSARPLNASRWDEAAMKRERAARDSVLRKIEAGAPDLLRGLLEREFPENRRENTP